MDAEAINSEAAAAKHAAEKGEGEAVLRALHSSVEKLKVQLAESQAGSDGCQSQVSLNFCDTCWFVKLCYCMVLILHSIVDATG